MNFTEALLASRRSFMVSAGALLFAQPKLILSKAPILWGDGEHDDTDALSALFSGKPVKTAGGDTFRSLFEDGWAALKGGRYRFSGKVKADAAVYLSDLYMLPENTESIILFGRDAAITGCTWRVTPETGLRSFLSAPGWRGGSNTVLLGSGFYQSETKT